MWYNKKHVFGFCLWVLAQTSLDPWTSLNRGDTTIFCYSQKSPFQPNLTANQVAQNRAQNSFPMGAGQQKDQINAERVEIFSPSSQLLGRREGPEIDWVIKALKQKIQRASGMNTLRCWEGTWPKKAWKLCTTPIPYILPWVICLAVPELYPLY